MGEHWAVIPARGGSKRIPKKNIKPFNGVPMLGLTIERLRQIALFDNIIVTTDDHDIHAVALEFGADIVIDRPSNLAGDHVSTQPVIQHALNTLSCHPDNYVSCVYACNPLIKKMTLMKCLDKLLVSGQYFSFPVLEYRHPIQRAFEMVCTSGELCLLDPDFELARTQDLEKRYHDAGSFYMAKAEIWLSERRIHENSIGVVVSDFEAVDIDNETDWVYAEKLALIDMNRDD